MGRSSERFRTYTLLCGIAAIYVIHRWRLSGNNEQQDDVRRAILSL